MLRPWTGKVCKAPSIRAYINGGRWLARCECGNVDYVTPDDPIFYCFICGNQAQSGRARPVVFPKNRKKIEAALLARPVRDETYQALPTQSALAARPLKGLRRDWNGETVKELLAANKEAGL